MSLSLMLECCNCDRYIKDSQLSAVSLMHRAKELGWECTDLGDMCAVCVMQRDQAMIDRAMPLDGLAAENASDEVWVETAAIQAFQRADAEEASITIRPDDADLAAEWGQVP